MNHLAIRNLYPSVVTIDDKGGAFDASGDKVTLDMDLINSWVNPDEYKILRAPEYPPLSELADALYHQQNGDDTKMAAYLAKCEAVKQKYPKE